MKLPTPSTRSAIYAALEASADRTPRPHLGASQIGKSCERALWYQFRWSTEEAHSGRMLRLFRRGQLEEAQLIADLRAAGVEVVEFNEHGEQFKVSAHGGHFGGSMDGVACKVPECSNPAKWHVLEFKTANAKSYAKLEKEGVEKAQPAHYAQMQMYMHLSGTTNENRLQRALYVCVCKNSDELYVERVKYSHAHAKALLERAERIIFTDEPPPRVSDDPSWYECKFCPHFAACHEKALPRVTCRSCAHSTVERDGVARWTCGLKGGDLSPAAQLKACGDHVYNPHLVTFAEAKDGSSAENWQEYLLPNGTRFRNGTACASVYGSEELRNLDVELIGDKRIDAIREAFGARVEALPTTDEMPFNDPVPF